MEYPGEFKGATAETIRIIDPNAAPTPTQETETVTPEVPAQTPIVDTVESTQPAEVTPDVTPAEQPTPTAPPPAVPQEATPPVVQKTWKDLLKEDGFDEKDLAMLEHRKKTGTYKDYLQAMSVDYSTMQPEEIMRRDLKEQYPNLPAESLERLYRKKVVEPYNLDSDLSPSEEDTAFGKDLLAHDAEAIRQKFIEKQNAFLIPDKDLQAEQQRVFEEQNRQAQAAQEQFRNGLLNSPAVQSLTSKKSLALDAGDGRVFNYAVSNPNDIQELLLNPEKYAEVINKNGQPDYDKMLVIAAVAKDPQGFMKSLIEHGINLGKKDLTEKDLENVTTGSGVSPVSGGLSFAEAWKQAARR